MLNLSTVTLLCVETRRPELAHWAVDQCLKGTRFSKVVLVTNLELVGQKRVDIEYVQAPPIRNIKDYSEFLLTGVDQFIKGSHVLIIQWDSFIIHPELWDEEFLAYDYIGSVWPHHPESPVGNGGFSLRSRKLLQAIKSPGFIKKHPEDYCICVDNKDFLEKQCNIKIAPVFLAEKFSVERTSWHKAFGFHGFFNFAKVLSDKQLRDFIHLVPDGYLSGLDTYDLIANLKGQGRVIVAKEIASKVHFRWNMRKRYLWLMLWLAST